jgi:uncharacterized membrane protein YgaE (UPF0421/DUF939 family)
MLGYRQKRRHNRKGKTEMKKEMKFQIAVVTACSLTAWLALVALFVMSSQLDILGVAVLTLVLMAFVGVGVGSLVEEYKNDQINKSGMEAFDTISELCAEIDALRLQVTELENEIDEDYRKHQRHLQEHKDLIQRYQTVKHYLLQNGIAGYAKMQ